MGIVFALALGWCGTHRFALGQWQMGLLHIFLFVVSMAALSRTPFGETPWLTLSALLAYYTAYRWWRMSDDEFAERYLEAEEPEEVEGKYLQGKVAPNPKVQSRRARRKILQEARIRYDEFDFQGAAERYEDALDLDLADGESRVLAARCYSLLEDEESAYRHLRKAVQLKAENLATVDVDEGFAWLRMRPGFSERRRAGYPVVAPSEVAPPDPQGLPSPQPSVLDRLEQLGNLRERGLLDDEEFAREKRRLLQ